jgi:hypothetical protein
MRGKEVNVLADVDDASLSWLMGFEFLAAFQQFKHVV